MHSFALPTLAVSSQNRLASLIVVDTTTERDVVVGDVLVEQTLGTKTPDTRKDEMGMEHFKLETPFVPVRTISSGYEDV